MVHGSHRLLTPFRAGLVFSAVRLLPSSFSFIYLLGQGISIADVSNARLIQLIALLVLEVPCGVLADRFGPRWSFRLSVLTSASWLGVMTVVDGFAILVVAELLNAVALSLFSGSFEMLLRDTHNAKNPLANFAKHQALWIAIASVAGAFFATAMSRQAAWILAALIQCVLFLALWRDARNHRSKSSSRPSPDVLKTSVMLILCYRTARAIPVRLWATFIAATVVFDVTLQFWQPIVVIQGVPSESNLALLLISLVVMAAMSVGSALAEKASARRLVARTFALLPLLLIAMTLFDGNARLIFTAVTILLLVIISTALQNRAAFQITTAVRGNAEVTAFSLISALARVLSGVLIVLVGTFMSTSPSVVVVMIILTAIAAFSILVGGSRPEALPLTDRI